MNVIYKVDKWGYYTDLDQAIKVGKLGTADVFKIFLNQEDDYKEKYLVSNVHGKFVYYTYLNGVFFDPDDKHRLQEEMDKHEAVKNKEFEERKKTIYSHTPDLGWCDYPEQFVEKCPSYKGVVKFELMERKTRPYYPVVQWRDCSSVDDNYYGDGIYIGNYDLGRYGAKFEKYDGKTKNIDGTLYPRIDAIWKFQTENYPLGNFIVDHTTLMKVENGKIIL